MGMNRLCAFPRIKLQTPGKDWGIFSDWLCLHQSLFSRRGNGCVSKLLHAIALTILSAR
jgi:hypothetical protein